jgi:glycosyltransferase involved in cell wall biosynthesis
MHLQDNSAMSDRPITHTVQMVTYNHEKYIADALNSLFDNRVQPDEVILHDDCSMDNTWNIVLDFKRKYPDILKIKRHEKNTGIFQNINSTLCQGSGDIITGLSGDDYLKPGLFEELNRVVRENAINVANDRFIIVTNTMQVFPNGTERVIENYKLRNNSLFKERLRYGLNYREVGISRNILKSVQPIRYDLGLHADWLHCLEMESLCEKQYFTDFVSSVYRCGVGTVSKAKSLDLCLSKQRVIDEVIKTFSAQLDKSDMNYLAFEKAYLTLQRKYSLPNVIRYIKYLLCNLRNFSANNGLNRGKIALLIPPNAKGYLKSRFSKQTTSSS